MIAAATAQASTISVSQQMANQQQSSAIVVGQTKQPLTSTSSLTAAAGSKLPSTKSMTHFMMYDVSNFKLFIKSIHA